MADDLATERTRRFVGSRFHDSRRHSTGEWNREMQMKSAEQVNGGRFAFGDNWLEYLNLVDEPRVAQAQESLTRALGVGDLSGRSFLDIGCGSGLFSLAAHRLGARVRSFDYDPQSVAATAELRRRFAPDSDWQVEQGSILDNAYISGLGPHDIVYSWGVLHHTGAMWQAIGATSALVAPGGLMFIAIYNDQGLASRLWWRVKQRYVRSDPIGRRALVLASGVYLDSRGVVARAVKRVCGHPVPAARDRGMSARHDLVDWVGGFPFEVATPEQIFAFIRERDFELRFLKTCQGGFGCNEFVFVRSAAASGAPRA
ncbi:class I SAM-dependent methyltransferase [Nonomuraea sp. NPDC005983]|uniref:class I SAM-dependent methyltransferase n=1 Tax=Nonomuraea sp. NPDC005983 TaxID=3155595 RepID=UPI0033B770A7